MGTISYGSTCEIAMDDYTLTHVMTAILTKLRIGQHFPFSWAHDDDGGRSTVWIHDAIAMRFEFNTDQRPELNGEWIDALLRAANDPYGMWVVPEP